MYLCVEQELTISKVAATINKFLNLILDYVYFTYSS